MINKHKGEHSMKHHKSIISTLLSTTFLLTSTLSAEVSIQCPGGNCHIVLPSKKDLTGVPRFLKNKIKRTSKSMVATIKLTADKYVAKAGEILESVNEMETIIASSYIMNQAEKIAYYKQEAEEKTLRKEAKNKRDSLLAKPNKELEEIIIEKTDESDDPTSEFYCEKNKKIRFLKEKNTFECVST